MQITIRVPAMNERGPQYMEQALAAIHQANPRRLPINLEFAHHRETVALACSFPHELRAAVEQQLFAHFPTAKSNTCTTTQPARTLPPVSAEQAS